MFRFTEFIIEKLFMPLSAIFLLFVICFFLFGLPYYLYQDSKAERFSLKKSEWSCVKTHSYQTTVYIKSGNVLIPSTTNHTDCLTYEKNDTINN